MNYYETFIQVAPDCPVTAAVVPVSKADKPTIPALEYELLSNHPYTYTQEEVLFEVQIRRLALPAIERQANRQQLWDEFFAKPHPCLRASPLAKKYGWGFHFDKEGKIKLVPMEGKEYSKFSKSKNLQQLFAMRSKRP